MRSFGPPQEECLPTRDEIVDWWKFVQGFLRTETAETGRISKPFSVSATHALEDNTIKEAR